MRRLRLVLRLRYVGRRSVGTPSSEGTPRPKLTRTREKTKPSGEGEGNRISSTREARPRDGLRRTSGNGRKKPRKKSKKASGGASGRGRGPGPRLLLLSVVGPPHQYRRSMSVEQRNPKLPGSRRVHALYERYRSRRRPSKRCCGWARGAAIYSTISRAGIRRLRRPCTRGSTVLVARWAKMTPYPILRLLRRRRRAVARRRGRSSDDGPAAEFPEFFT